MEEFIKNFANQFDDTELSEFNADTNFRDLEEWSSLTALAVMNMMEKKYNTPIKVDELNKMNTIGELFELIK